MLYFVLLLIALMFVMVRVLAVIGQAFFDDIEDRMSNRFDSPIGNIYNLDDKCIHINTNKYYPSSSDIKAMSNHKVILFSVPKKRN